MNKNDIALVIEAGHRKRTAGKHSPDKIFKEWEWNEDVKNTVIETLVGKGYRVYDATPKGDVDSLSQRVKYVNDLCDKFGKNNVIYVSVHANAAGNGQWMNARRWSIWTSRGVTESDAIAEELYYAAIRKWDKGAVRSDISDGDHDYEADFYVLKHSKCPAVLIENFFYDNKEDLAYLLSATSHYDCAEVICNGIENYVKTH